MKTGLLANTTGPRKGQRSLKMKHSMIIGLTAAAVMAVVPVATAVITIPDGSLSATASASGNGGYDYAISSSSIDAQSVSEAHITGQVTAYSLPNVNAGWFSIGLITQSERDRALVTYV